MAQEQIPLTAVIVDDGGYGMLRYDQARAGAESYGVDLQTPDFTALAASFGIRAETVRGLDDEFGEALAEHVADPAPSVLVAATPTPLVPPPNTSPELVPPSALEAEVRVAGELDEVHLGLLELARVVPVHRLPAGELVEHPDARLARAVAGLAVAAERQVRLGARGRVVDRDHAGGDALAELEGVLARAV